MKFWEKIENLINDILEKIGSFFVSTVKKATPPKVDNIIKKSQLSTKEKKEQALKRTLELKEKGLKKAIELKTTGLEKAIKTKEKTLSTVTTVKTYDYKSLNLKKITAVLTLFLGPTLLRIKTWVVALKPTTIIGVTIGTSVVTLTSISIISSGKKIAEETMGADFREPASVEKATKVSRNPAYFKKHERELRISNVNMPIYIGSKKDLKSLRVDFTFVGSNRYIKSFFMRKGTEDKTYLIQDKINSSLQPVVPEFPLDPEGKQILKTKIKSDLNELLKTMKIKGEIEDIYIHSILAG